MTVKTPMTIADQQEFFDLLASVVERAAETGDQHPVFWHAREVCEAKRDTDAITRELYLKDYTSWEQDGLRITLDPEPDEKEDWTASYPTKPAAKPVLWYPPAKRKRETKWHRASPIVGDEQRAFCNYNLMLDLEQSLDNEQIHSELRCKRCMTETGLGD